ncbi:MAG: hypothetical protein ACKO3W_08425, partial [bacterium]
MPSGRHKLGNERRSDELPILRVIEPNLAGPSGHYAEFVRALAARSGGVFHSIEVVGAPGAERFLSTLGGEVAVTAIAQPRGPFGELRAIRASLAEGRRTLVLTATAAHAILADRAAVVGREGLGHLAMFVHWPLVKPAERLALLLAGRAHEDSLFIVPTR